ncbi:hypothetical protein [Nocardia brasiliensis]|uniref:hypothetical protein n=1 Tax=Nocardia brasiliensis TaxID=37326 RepID=UPI002457D1DF|nr:hypothetical protein [Nocardia brasiliensis]
MRIGAFLPVLSTPPGRGGARSLIFGGLQVMPNVGGRRYRGKHRVVQGAGHGRPRLFATLLAGALLTPAALSLSATTAGVAQAASFGFRAKVQGYDKDGRAIIHYNNKIHDPGIENAVKHLNATPGLNIVLEPGTGNGAIDISNEHFQGDVAGLGGWDNGPFVKLDPKNSSFDPADRTEIAGHELLHAIGLDHNDSGCSIMASVVNRCGDGPSPLGKSEVGELNKMYQRGKPNNSESPAGSTPQKGDPGDRPTRPGAPRPKPEKPSVDDQQTAPGDGSDQFGDDQSGDTAQPGDPFGDDSFGGDFFDDDSFDGDDPFSGDYTDLFGDGSDAPSPDDAPDGFDWLGDGRDDASGDPFGDLFGTDTGDPFSSDNSFDWFGDSGWDNASDGTDMFGGDSGQSFDWFGDSGTRSSDSGTRMFDIGNTLDTVDRSGGDQFIDFAGAGLF